MSADVSAHLRPRRALVQHHDSVPGTMRTAVSSNETFFIGNEDVKSNYSAILWQAQDAARTLLAQSMSNLIGSVSSGPDLALVNSTMPMSAPGVVVLTNALAVELDNSFVCIAVDTVSFHNWTVWDNNGNLVTSQMGLSEDGAVCVAVSVSIPAMGFLALEMRASAASPQEPVPAGDETYLRWERLSEPAVLTNGILEVMVSADGELTGIVDLSCNWTTTAQYSAGAYVNATGGAYIMYESGPPSTIPAMKGSGVVLKGPVFSMACASYPEDVNRVCVRLAAGQRSVDVIHDIGPLTPTHEFVSRISTGWETGGTPTVETGMTGFEMIERPFNASLTIPGNYHALVHSAQLRRSDGDGMIALVSGHSCGVTSAVEGEIELMLARRTLYADSQGPWPLDDDAHLHMTISIVPGQTITVESIRPQAVQERNVPVQSLASRTTMQEWQERGWPWQASFVDSQWSPSLDLLTLALRSCGPGTIDVVMRMHHMYEKNVQSPYAVSVPIDLSLVLPGVIPASVHETTLTVSDMLANVIRRDWRPIGDEIGRQDQQDSEDSGDIVPGDIRTFLVSYVF
jgi:hypothetical protein